MQQNKIFAGDIFSTERSSSRYKCVKRLSVARSVSTKADRYSVVCRQQRFATPTQAANTTHLVMCASCARHASLRFTHCENSSSMSPPAPPRPRSARPLRDRSPPNRTLLLTRPQNNAMYTAVTDTLKIHRPTEERQQNRRTSSKFQTSEFKSIEFLHMYIDDQIIAFVSP